MSEQDEVQVPPTETEVAILTEVLAGGYRLIVRKLAFQRDRLQAEVERLRAQWSIAMKALADIDSGFPDPRHIAGEALRRIEDGNVKATHTEGGGT